MKIEIKFTDGSGKVHEYIVDDSLISSKAIQAEAERYQQTTANNMGIERIAFEEGALFIKDVLFSFNE